MSALDRKSALQSPCMREVCADGVHQEGVLRWKYCFFQQSAIVGRRGGGSCRFELARELN